MGKAYFYARRQVSISSQNIHIDDAEKEVKDFINSIEISKYELNKIYCLSVERIGEKNSVIFQAQLDILNDSIFVDRVIKRIQQEKKKGAYILNDELTKLSNILLASNNDYMKERFLDVNDIKNRVIRNMKRDKLFSKVEEESIIFAHELTPADTILFSKRKVKGYATDTGGTTSHTAIISRALRVPAVVGMKTISKNVSTGDFVIINGFDGEVIINPQEETISRYRLKREEFIHHESRLIETINLPCETLDKKSVEISANIEFIEEVEFLVNCGHCGIGLYRTEHLFMSKGDYPSEAEQIEEYMHIANVTFPKNVTLRTFDLGGDKVLPTSVKEINPNLGWRGIRISLDRTDIFKIQLRAMLLSSVKKNIKVMFPMISSLDEVRKAKEILNEVKTELNNQGAVFDNDIKTGIMVEIPSAFVLADDLAKEVDFFSVGTNDLTQYMLAVDRGNELISGMYQQLHPAIIRALKAIVSSAHSNNITVSICGEMASIPIAVPLLVGLGFDELSVNPGIFPEIKQIVRNINYADSKKLSEQVQTISTESELIKVLDKFLSEKVKDKLI